MKSKHSPRPSGLRRIRLPVLLSSGLLVVTLPVLADSDTLLQLPTTQSVGVTPNVLLVLDDSGSMTWEDTFDGGSSYQGYSMLYKKRQVCEWVEKKNGNGWKWSCEYVFKPQDLSNKYFCADSNSQAYDSDQTYLPWKSGNGDERYDDMDPTAAWIDFNEGDDKDNLVDLTDPDLEFRYYTDSNCSDSSEVQVSDLSLDKQVNYANWFTYYRSRLNVGKAAGLELLSDIEYRTGFITINPGSETATKVKVDDILDSIIEYVTNVLGNLVSVVTTSDSGNDHLDDIKNAIVKTEISSSNTYVSTPLREALYRAGEYYSDNYSSLGATPILSEDEGGMCQQNFTVLITDGFWNSENSTASSNIESKIGDANGDGRTWRESYNYSYGGNATLADVAYYYAHNDLLPKLGSGTYEKQVMTTYTVAFGVESTSNDWSDNKRVIESSSSTIDDLEQAAIDGGGSYFNASSPTDLVSALAAIASEIVAVGNSVSGLSTNLTTASVETDSRLVESRYSASTWTGDVVASSVQEGNDVEEDDQLWSAATQLSEALAEEDGLETRTVFTMSGGNGVEFTTNNAGRLSSSQRNDLARMEVGGNSTDDHVKAAIEWLRGSDEYEGDGLRNRTGVQLGDIIGSSPVVVTREDSTTQGSVFVGANDGMLHAFDLNTGNEQFAYIPELLYSEEDDAGLGYLTDPGYQHRYYVDGELRLASLNGEEWLVSGLAGGGRGLFALNVTKAVAGEDFDEDDVVRWEFGSSDDDDMGHVFGSAHIVSLNNGDSAVLVGNGLETADENAAPTLFALELDGVNAGGVIAKLSPSGVTGGLANLQVADIDSNGTVDFAYGGDLQGRLWKFDLSDDDSSKWSVTRLFTACATSLTGGECQTDALQPITVKPTLSRYSGGTQTMSSPNLLVSFGTGQDMYADAEDEAWVTQSLYTVLDAGGSHTSLMRSNLEERTFVSGSYTNGELTGRTLGGDSFSYYPSQLEDQDSDRFGWYLDLDASEQEELVEPANLLSNLVVFSTSTSSTGTNFCESTGGGWLVALDTETGLPTYDDSEGSYVTIFDFNQDEAFSADDLVGTIIDNTVAVGNVVVSVKLSGTPTSSVSVGNTVYVGSSSLGTVEGTVSSYDLNVSSSTDTGRVSWYQLR
ncbi:pilus assembly protein [Cobetia marina]|uniref:pilus assembly protein n=1 Tax=Cobetia marina TaxID=28258 RepID=UPI002548928F|nr:PilC/PilY family type IV pilus protein [Cobetia pacifica]MDI6005060.1 PilC/PilY family type IV pilus protein [Cobetia pacifica]